MFIYRDEVYHKNSKGIAEIIIGKQRNGPIGACRLVFQGQFSRFENYAGPRMWVTNIGVNRKIRLYKAAR